MSDTNGKKHLYEYSVDPLSDTAPARVVRAVGQRRKVLEIGSSATDEEVKKAYKKMAMKHHPDRVATLGADVRIAAEEKFKSIVAAYEVIKKERNFA